MTIEEDEVMPARRLFAHPLRRRSRRSPRVRRAAPGWPASLRVCADEAAFEALNLDRRSRVLLINSEGNLGEQPA